MFGERLFGLDAQTLFDAGIVAVNMFVLFIFVSYFLLNPVRNLLDKRKERIANDRDQAEKDKLEAAKLKEDYDAKIDSIAELTAL